MHYSEVPCLERKEFLRSMFRFDCNCQACSEGWPTYSDLSEATEDDAVIGQLKQIDTAINLALSKFDLSTAIALHCKDVTLIENSFKEPHRLFATVRNSFQVCLWKLFQP